MKTNVRALRPIAVVATSLITLLFWMNQLWSNMGPVVLQDELLFSYLATQEPNLSPYSNSLFSAVFSSAANCAPDVLTCARWINLGFWALIVAVMAGWTYYSNSTAVMLISIWAGTSIISFYVATFLPEVMYYSLVLTALSLVFWGMLSTAQKKYLWPISMVFLGAAMLVKPHAIFVTLILVSALALLQTIRDRGNRSEWAWIGALAAAPVLIRITIDFLLGTNFPLSLFASYLPGPADSTPSFQFQFPDVTYESQYDSDLTGLALSTVVPYFAVAALIYLPPLLFSLRALIHEKGQNALANSAFLASFVALGMHFVAWAFGLRATLAGDYHGDRILMRYSEFLVPFSLVLLVAMISKMDDKRKNWWIYGLVPLAMGALAIVLGALTGVSLNAADSLLIFSFSGFFGWQLLVATGLGLLFLGARFTGKPVRTVGALTLTAGLLATSWTHNFGMSNYYVEESRSYSTILESARALGEVDLLVIGSKRAVVAHLLMQSGNYDAKYALIGGYNQIPADFVSDFDYAIVHEEIYPPNHSTEIVSSDVTTLYRLNTDSTLEDALYAESPDVSNFSSIGVPTEWGYWVRGQATTVTFNEKLQPGSAVTLEVIRHQSTIVDEMGVRVDAEQPIPLLLEEAGKIYEIQLNVGQNGMDSITLTFDDAFRVEGALGMQYYSFGISRVRVVVP